MLLEVLTFKSWILQRENHHHSHDLTTQHPTNLHTIIIIITAWRRLSWRQAGCSLHWPVWPRPKSSVRLHADRKLWPMANFAAMTVVLSSIDWYQYRSFQYQCVRSLTRIILTLTTLYPSEILLLLIWSICSAFFYFVLLFWLIGVVYSNGTMLSVSVLLY